MQGRRIGILGIVAAMAVALVAYAAPVSASDDHPGPQRTYRITVENLTGGQPLTPAVVGIHRDKHEVFRVGEEASNGIQQLAENGGVPVLAAELADHDDIGTVAVVGDAPIGPGGSATALVTAAKRDRRISLAAMLVCTNDGFAGIDSQRLPRRFGDPTVLYAYAFDAGTEINTEAYADLVPPCDGMGGSGMSNPALAEGGVIHRHDGIMGGADLDPAVHGWDGPVARITIERVRVYEVTVENLTAGQPLTPTVFATHRSRGAVFRPGHEASNGIQQLAENGGVPVLVAELTSRRDIGTVAVVGDAPIGPGGSATTSIIVADRYRRATLAGMLVCTNDGFAGRTLRLPKWIGDAKTVYARAFDAGTEINTEAYADLVPPCDGMGGSGMSNPALAEGGVIHRHDGIMGGADLDPAVHGWDGPVVRITVERVG